MLLRLNSIKLLFGTLMVLFCTTTDSLAKTVEKEINKAIISITKQCTLTPIFTVSLKDGTSYEAEVNDLNLTLFPANSTATSDIMADQECNGTFDGLNYLTCSPLTVKQSMVDFLIENEEINDFRMTIGATGELVLDINAVLVNLDCDSHNYYYAFETILICLVSPEFEGTLEDCPEEGGYAELLGVHLKEEYREYGQASIPVRKEDSLIEITPIHMVDLVQQKSYKKPLPKIYPVQFFR